jgi:hypothetical protein
MNIWKERINEVKEMLLSGMTLQQVGDHYNVSRERIRQINKKYIKLNRHDYGASKKVKDKNKEKVSKLLALYGKDKWRLHDDLAKAIAAKITRKKANCKKTQWEFNLDMGDIDFPRYCPVLDIELDYFSERISPSSPSFDRIDPTKGYVTGNVVILSHKASSIKRRYTYDQLIAKGTEVHLLVAEWLNQLPSSSLQQGSDLLPSHSVGPD